MADIRCPHCGKQNPDFLDVCQFCQSPLKSESMMHPGDKPTKKNTGELEGVLPDWLKDARQQARDLAEENAAEEAARPKPQKEEPLDLLAGLAFQSGKGDEEEVPDWLASLSSKDKPGKPIPPSTPPAPAPDFFAQFNQSAPKPDEQPAQEEETSSSMSNFGAQPQQAPERDELSEWFARASEQPAEEIAEEPDLSQIDSGWSLKPEQPAEQATPREEEDLTWLRNLEEESKKTDDLSPPKQEADWFTELSASGTSSAQGDLSWLNNLGALPPTDGPAQAPSQPQEDLSWLNALGGTPPAEEPSQPPSARKEDLSWLNTFPERQETSKPATLPAAQEDLSWLNDLGGISQSEQPIDFLQQESLTQPESAPSTEQPSAQDDLSWLANLQGSAETLSSTPFADFSSEQEQSKSKAEQPEIPHVSPFTPRRTEPLSPAEPPVDIPDWLKSATETPSMPLSSQQLDQFREDYKIPTAPEEPFSWKNFVPEAKDDEAAIAPADAGFFPTGNDSTTLSNQDVDSLFSVDMPDWLSRAEPEAPEPAAPEIGIHAEGGEALSPVDLPSWVQAMRPVEAGLAGTSAIEDLPTERIGPLAGFRGVIPAAPIGSSRRPQSIPLKLQASEEQQASAGIMEQILVSETSPRVLPSAPTSASQRMLRQGIAVLLWVALSAVIFLRTQMMPVSAALPPEVSNVSNVITGIPENSNVLVVLDYEPSLAGEMEAVSAPLLDQLALMRHPLLSFIATSPTSVGLAERLLSNTNINKPEGLDYRLGEQYFNLGFLPGGEAGVLSFLQSPQSANPAANVSGLSQYAAVLILTDHADSARVWVEQLESLKQADPTLANQPLLLASSAQAGPMLQPYVSSGQVDGLINGLSNATRLEFGNNGRPGIARSYWDAFGIGTWLAIALIVLGSVWSLVTGIQARRLSAGEG